MMGLRMNLVQVTKPSLAFSLHKRCPDCGADNDLAEVMGTWSDQVIPLCGSCGTFLWKRLPNWKKWMEAR